VGKPSLNAGQPYAKAEGRVFLLVLAYPGCPGTKAVKRLLLLFVTFKLFLHQLAMLIMSQIPVDLVNKNPDPMKLDFGSSHAKIEPQMIASLTSGTSRLITFSLMESQRHEPNSRREHSAVQHQKSD